MPFGKSDPAQAAVKQAEKRYAAWRASPAGQAHASFESGAAFFQIQLDISEVGGGFSSSAFGSSSGRVKNTGGRPDVLGQIEEVGWRLEDVGYVFVETGSTSSNRIGSTGQGTVTRGKVVGIYLFRREPGNVVDAALPVDEEPDQVQPAGTAALSTPAGWYPDPEGSQLPNGALRRRWWDGDAWTEHYES